MCHEIQRRRNDALRCGLGCGRQSYLSLLPRAERGKGLAPKESGASKPSEEAGDEVRKSESLGGARKKVDGSRSTHEKYDDCSGWYS